MIVSRNIDIFRPLHKNIMCRSCVPMSSPYDHQLSGRISQGVSHSAHHAAWCVVEIYGQGVFVARRFWRW